MYHAPVALLKMEKVYKSFKLFGSFDHHVLHTAPLTEVTANHVNASLKHATLVLHAFEFKPPHDCVM